MCLDVDITIYFGLLYSSREYSRNMLMNDRHEKRFGMGQHEKRSTRKKNRKWSTRKKKPEVVNTKKKPEVVNPKKDPEVARDLWPLTRDLWPLTLTRKKSPLLLIYMRWSKMLDFTGEFNRQFLFYVLELFLSFKVAHRLLKLINSFEFYTNWKFIDFFFFFDCLWAKRIQLWTLYTRHQLFEIREI